MLLWFVLLAILAGVVALLVRPFVVEGKVGMDASNSAAAIYKDQLAEVDIELANGTIDEAQAAAARLEIKRRLLQRLPDAQQPARRLAAIERKFLGGTIAAGIGLGSLIVYGSIGNPGLPSAPGRSAQVASAPSASAAQGFPGSTAGSADPAQAAGRSLPSVEDMIERIVERLKASPGDANGWRMLAWSYAGVGRFDESASAYAKAIELQPSIGPLHTARADALVRAAGGKVTADALAGYETALRLDPKDGPALYGLGLARRQAGDSKDALAKWLDALAAGGPNEAWTAEIEPQVRSLAAELGIDVSARLPATAQAAPSGGILGRLQQDAAAIPPPTPAAPAPAAPPPGERGPNADDIRAAGSLSPGQRQAMVAGMVDGLEQRLDKQPRDAEGWIRLIRSRMVLGEMDRAKAAFTRAVAVFADSPDDRRRIEAAAGEVGVKP